MTSILVKHGVCLAVIMLLKLNCNKMTVLVFHFIIHRARHNAKYCNFFIKSILIKNRANGSEKAICILHRVQLFVLSWLKE